MEVTYTEAPKERERRGLMPLFKDVLWGKG